MSVLNLTSNDFDNIIKKGTVLIDFYADWCGPCKKLTPIIEELSNERDDIVFGKLNVDDAPEIPSKFGILSIPTLILFKEGREVKRMVGYKSKAALLSTL